MTSLEERLSPHKSTDVEDASKTNGVADTTSTSSPSNDEAAVDEAKIAATWNMAVELANSASKDGEEDDDDPVGSAAAARSIRDILDDPDKLLEQLLNLRLNPGDTVAGGPPNAASAGTNGGSGKTSSYQPRSKLEQLEDILFESQILDSVTGGGTGVPNPFPVGPDGVDGLEERLKADLLEELHLFGASNFEASDAIFAEDDDFADVDDDEDDDTSSSLTSKSKSAVAARKNSTTSSEASNRQGGNCDCSSCKDRSCMDEEKRREILTLREVWAALREDVCEVYRRSIDNVQPLSSKDGTDAMEANKDRVRKLCRKDPHQLYKRLESKVEVFIHEVKTRLMELIESKANNPELAQDFIKGKFSGFLM